MSRCRFCLSKEKENCINVCDGEQREEFKIKLLEFGVPTKKGHVYKFENIEFPPNKMLFGTSDRTEKFGEASIFKLAATARTLLKEDGVYAEVTIYKTPAGNDFKKLLFEGGFYLVPDVTGRYDEQPNGTQVIKECKLSGFYLRKTGIYD